MTAAEIRTWFLAHDWGWCPTPAVDEIVMRSRADMPDGTRREATLRAGPGGRWSVAVGIRAVTGEYQSFGPPAVVGTLDDLDIAIATFGPMSFRHIVVPFCGQLGLAVPAAYRAVEIPAGLP